MVGIQRNFEVTDGVIKQRKVLSFHGMVMALNPVAAVFVPLTGTQQNFERSIRHKGLNGRLVQVGMKVAVTIRVEDPTVQDPVLFKNLIEPHPGGIRNRFLPRFRGFGSGRVLAQGMDEHAQGPVQPVQQSKARIRSGYR